MTVVIIIIAEYRSMKVTDHTRSIIIDWLLVTFLSRLPKRAMFVAVVAGTPEAWKTLSTKSRLDFVAGELCPHASTNHIMIALVDFDYDCTNHTVWVDPLLWKYWSYLDYEGTHPYLGISLQDRQEHPRGPLPRRAQGRTQSTRLR